MEKEWYVVNTYSGHEAKVKEKLESRAVSMGMQDHIFRVIVPETTEVDIKDGVKKEKVKKMFPGYVFSPSPGGGLKTHNDIIWLMSVWDGKFYKMTKKEWEGLGYILDGNRDFIDFVERVSKNIGYCLYD